MPRRPTANRQQMNSRIVWSEPNVKLNGLTHYNITSGEITADGVQLSSDWLATTLTGTVDWAKADGEISLAGPARLRMDEVSRRLTALFGTRVHVEGIHETPLQILATRKAGQPTAFSVNGNLGWESGEIGSVAFGPASVPVKLTETGAPGRDIAIGPLDEFWKYMSH